MTDIVKTQVGKISYLRVHEAHSGFGAASDYLDAEVIVRFENDGSKAYGFQLRNDDNLPAAQAMFALLQDGFNADEPVTIDYVWKELRNHYRLIRVMRVK